MSQLEATRVTAGKHHGGRKFVPQVAYHGTHLRGGAGPAEDPNVPPKFLHQVEEPPPLFEFASVVLAE